MTTHCQRKLLSHHQRFLLTGTEFGSARLSMQGRLLVGRLTAAHGNVHKWHTVGRGSLYTFSSMLTRTCSLPQSRSAAYYPTLLRSRRMRSVVHHCLLFKLYRDTKQSEICFADLPIVREGSRAMATRTTRHA